MDSKRVQFLEEEIGAAIAEVLGRSDVDDMPNEQIMHLMAKAAVRNVSTTVRQLFDVY
jgi:hypothetical protein